MTIMRRETGIVGLDKLISGGFPVPSTVLIGGEPGTGKTTLAVQTLFYGAKKGEVGIYITAISEPRWVVQKFLSEFTFYDEAAIDKEKILFLEIRKSFFEEPGKLLPRIKQFVERYEPQRVVIDPITPIKAALDEKGVTREFLHDLFEFLKGFNCISIITAELSYNEIPKSLEGYMVDGIILLSYPEEKAVRRKFLEVLKMRGTKHVTGKQLVDITNEGFLVHAGLR
ncbi:MAG: KaiA-binding protein [Thermoplasmata archaeon]|nr:MAG: KaiA-binding protein [Thermoplasmata archaeon]